MSYFGGIQSALHANKFLFVASYAAIAGSNRYFIL